jgi:muramoyltetrapeptide carboxypeptidase
MIKPHKLHPGDAICLLSPSSGLAGLLPHRVTKAKLALEALGLKVFFGKNALQNHGYVSATAGERADDINLAFQDPDIKAIMTLIGGNHSNQLLPLINFELIKDNPKVFIGYSDITVLHNAINTQSNLVTFYGPAGLTQMAENPAVLDYTLNSFRKTLFDESPVGQITPSSEWTDEVLDWFQKKDLSQHRKMKKNPGWTWIKEGSAEGVLTGGCLTSLMHVRGTKYWPDFNGKILLWEISERDGDFTRGESIANVDAYLTDLELSGVYGQISGMVIGRPFGYTDIETAELSTLLSEKFAGYGFPILFGIDSGHSDPMLTLPLGVRVRLDSDRNSFKIIENAVI